MPTTSFEKVLLFKVIRCSYQLFYFLFYISFYINRYHFYNFLEFHSTLFEKKFRPKLFFVNGFTVFHQPHPLIAQNLLNVTKHFCRFSRKCLMKYFLSKNLLTKSCNAFFKSSNCRFFSLLLVFQSSFSLLFKQFLDIFLYWFYIFNHHNFIFQRLI